MTQAEPKPPPPNKYPTETSTWQWIKIVLFVSVLIAIFFYGWLHRESLTIENLARYESQVREFQQANPLLLVAIVFTVYATVTAFPLPFATPMSLAIGWFFGLWRGVLLVSFASTAGATLALLMTRYLLRDTFESKFGDRLKKFDEALEREGAFYLFTLRLVPAVPFFVINAVMGLTRVRVTTFWWVSQLGMLPGTILYIHAGSSLPSLKDLASPDRPPIFTWNLIIAFAALGLFPIIVKKTFAYFRGGSAKNDDVSET